VIYRKMYKFGDKVDTSHLVEGRAEALVESGALVESKDDLRTRRSGLVPRVGSRVTGAATAPPADHSEHFDVDEDEDDTESQTADDGKGEDPDNPEDVDEFTGMDYGELQDAAKAASPPIAANQSADDLRDALRAQKS
jgi:hypothetical protein